LGSRPATTLLSIGQRAVAIQVRGFDLQVEDGPDAGKTARAKSRSVTIGTQPTCDLALADPHISRLHCRIDVEGQDYVVRDLGSTNGTRVAGVRIREACLADGAVIDLGTTKVKFKLTGEPFEIPLAAEDAFEGLIGRSVGMRELFEVLGRVSPTEAPVLIEGETGTGKELVARAIHTRSRRAARPFVVFDCGAVPPTLIESELFGHEKGAFTGAAERRAGVFERAEGGTVFLDEMGELAVELQPKLLRVLESGELSRVGGSDPVKVDVRVLAATNRDLERLIAEGRFRADLYYRLAVIRVRVPPLRERRDDVPLLAAHFARNLIYAGPRSDGLAGGALETIFDFLSAHDWPGNVRELRNVVERAIILADPKILRGEALDALGELRKTVERSLSKRISLRAAREQREREYLEELLRAVEWDLDAAANLAEVHRKSLERLIRKHRLR
jgi:transcriptional regulator with GAF, ATPase, and Fis domain